MGQVASSFGETLGAAAGAFSKSLTTMIGSPKHPLDMPNLGDGRTQDTLRNEAEMMYQMDTKNNINIAFIGLNTESKLDLIHALRVTPECRTVLGISAPKGVATCYVHADKSYKHVRFWDITDLPGNYEQRCLFAFDCVVILTSDMIRQGDIDLIKQSNIVSGTAPVVVARQDMDSYVDKHLGLEPNENSIHTGKARQGPIIKDGMKTQLKKGGIDCPHQLESVYLISPPGMLAARAINYDGTKYIWDEFDFMKAMLDVVSKRRY